ncbi:MAG: hypothetical protein IKO25_09010, partial [Clostridia bacterium]|nr:hypothetical protein [Clostridia bacterium]
VFVYDDRIVVFYNIRGGKQVTPTDLLDSLNEKEDPESNESNSESSSGIGYFKFEPMYIFLHGVFGCVFRL